MVKEMRGNPIDMPHAEQNCRGGRQNTRPVIPQGLQVGRDSIDRPTSSSSSRQKGSSSNGIRSLALNSNRMDEKRESKQSTSSSFSQYPLLNVLSGASLLTSPSSEPRRTLQMRHDSGSSPNMTRNSALIQQAQHRNASINNGEIISLSVRANSRVNLRVNRSPANRTEVHIVVDGSGDDDKHIIEQASSSQSPQHRSPILQGSEEGEEQEKQASESSAESLTSTSDTELGNEGMTREKENIDSNGGPYSTLNSRPQKHGRSNSIGDQSMFPRHKTPVSAENYTLLTKKSLTIVKPLDREKMNSSKIAHSMKGKDGQIKSSQTKSMIPTPKRKAYDDKFYISGLDSSSKSPAKLEKPLVVKLRMVAFVQDGIVESIANSFVEWKLSGESIEIGWEEDGKGLKRQKISIKFDDCESFRASKDSSSMRTEPHRYLEIKLTDGSDSADSVNSRLENVMGFGSVRGGKLIVLDAMNNDAKEEHNWIDLRERLSKLRDKTLQDLENDEAEEIKARIEKMKTLSSRTPSNSPRKEIKQTPISRPKPRPSVTNSSNQLASTSRYSHRTSVVRGVKRNDEKEYPQTGRETAIN